MARYQHIRGDVDGMDGDDIDDALFGLLLSAENMCDEMRAYEEQTSWLLRLALIGGFVRQVYRLHGVLDAITSQYSAVNELASMSEWKAALDRERSARVDRYNDILSALGTTDDSEMNREWDHVFHEIETEEQQEEVLTLLKAAISKYGDDVLTVEEIKVTKTAFQIVADRSCMSDTTSGAVS